MPGWGEDYERSQEPESEESAFHFGNRCAERRGLVPAHICAAVIALSPHAEDQPPPVLFPDFFVYGRQTGSAVKRRYRTRGDRDRMMDWKPTSRALTLFPGGA